MTNRNSSPLTLSVRDLEHRPGTMRNVDAEVPVPEDFGTPLVGAPQGAPMELQLRLESVVDGILVSGAVIVPIRGECSRCLDPIEYDLPVDVQELFVFDIRSHEDGEDVEDEQVYEVRDEEIDLEPMLRDAVITQLPFQPVCRVDCPGLCDHCGARLEDHPDHHHEVLDPRWSALAGLLTDDPEGSGTSDQTTESREER